MSDKNFKVKNGIDAVGPITISPSSNSIDGIVINTLTGGKAIRFIRVGSGEVASIDEWGGFVSSGGISVAQPWYTRTPGLESQSFFWAASSTRSAAGFGGTSTGTNPVVYISSHGSGVNDLTQWVTPNNTILAKVDYLGNVTANDLTLAGNLTVNGTTTNLNSTNLIIEDKNIIIADVATPTNTTADGAGITIKGATDKTFNWVQSTGRFTSSEPIQSPSLVISTPTNMTNAGTFYNSAGTPVFNVDTSLNAINIGGGLSGTANNFASTWGYDSVLNAGYMTFQTGALGSDSLAMRRTNYVASGDYTISTLGNMRLSTAGGKNFNFNNGNIGVATTAIGTNNKIIVNPYSTVDNLATVQINTNAATNKGLVIQGYTSQTANLQEWQDSAGTVNAFVNSSAQLAANRVTAGSPTIQTGARLFGVGGVTTDVVLGLRGAASATGDYVRMFTNAGVVMGGYNALGQSFTGSTTPILVATGGATTAASGDGTTATVTTTSAHGLAVGDLITIAGITPTGYNATALLTAVASTTISYLNATTGAQTIAGTVSAPAQASVTARSAGTVPLAVSGGSTASIQQWLSGSSVASEIRNSGQYRSATGAIFGTMTGTTQSLVGVWSNSATAVTFAVNASTSQTANLQEWRTTSGTQMVVNAAGQFQAYQPALKGMVVKAATTLTATITNAVGNATTVTYTATNTFTAGQIVTITAVDPVAYNLTSVTIATASASSFTVTNAAVGTYVSGGTATVAQSANLQEWQDSAGTVFASVNASGNLILGNQYISHSGSSAYGRFQPLNGGTNQTILYPASDGMLIANAGVTGMVVVKVKGMSGQTGNLQEWQNSSGTVLASVGSAGTLNINTSGTGTINIGDGVLAKGPGNGFTFNSDINITDGKALNSSLGRFTNVTGITTVPLKVKAIASQTANLQEWQDSTNDNAMFFNAGYGNGSWNSLTFSTARSFKINWGSLPILSTYTGGLVATPYAANRIAFAVQGAASQTANLQEWQDSAGTVLAKISSAGTARVPIITDVAATGSLIYMNASNVEINTRSVGNIGLIVSAVASQTADLQQWRNSAGTVLANIDSAGNITATSYNLSNSLYSIRKNIKKTIDPASNAISGNTYDLFQMSFPSSLQGVFSIQVSVRGSGYGQSMSYTLPATYVMDWLSQYGITNPFTDSTTWVDLTPITFAPRHLMTNDYLKFQARVNANIIYFRIKLTGALTGSPLFDIYMQHSEEFANSTITELFSTGTDATTSAVMPNFLSSKAGTSVIFNPLAITASSAANLPLTVKGAASQTANLQEWQNSAGTVLSSVSAAGLIRVNNTNTDAMITATGNSTYDAFRFRSPGGLFLWGGGSNNNIYYASTGTFALTGGNWASGRLAVDTGSTGTVGIIVRGQAFQTANLQEWQDSTGAVKARVLPDGAITSSATIGATFFSNGDATTPYIDFNTANKLIVQTRNSAYVGLTVKGAASQTANLQEWQQSDGTITSYVGNDGNIFIQNNRALFVNSGYAGSASLVTKAAGPTWRGLVVQGAASQTANLQEWQNSAGQVRAKIDSYGGFSSLATATISNDLNGNGTSLVVQTKAAGGIPIVVKGFTSQTANLQEWQNSAGTAVAYVRNDGLVNTTAGILATGAFIAAGGYLSGTQMASVANTASVIGLIVRGAASQTANLQEWQDSAGTVLAKINPYGNLQIANIQADGFIGFGNAPVGTARVIVGAGIASYVGLMVKGAASQTANLQEWQNSAGTVIANIYSNGTAGLYGLEVFTGGAQITGNYANTDTLQVNINGAARRGILVKAAASQTGDLQQWQNSAGTVLAKVAADGQLSVGNGTSNYLSTYDAYGNITSRTAGTNYSANISVLTGATSYIGMVIRGLASQTASLQEWQNSAGTLMATVKADGSFRAGGANGATKFLVDQFGTLSLGTDRNITGTATYLFVQSQSTTDIGAVIKGFASQTANLQEWQDSAGTVLVRVTSSGVLGTSVGVYSPYYQGHNGVGGAIAFANATAITITPQSASVASLIVKGAASQTANLQEWQNSAGTVLAKIDKDGNNYSNAFTTPGFEFYSAAENSGGFVFLKKETAAAVNPGAGAAKIYFRDGTTAGTLKLVVRAGASGAETTILDNIPQS